ncbi:MAG: diguanylate cyclase [Treponema sp.]|nr:diguanylate cyclase [Treponema sp.]
MFNRLKLKSFKSKILVPSVGIMMLVLVLFVTYSSIAVRRLTDALAEERALMISQATALRLDELADNSALAAQLVAQSDFIADVVITYAATQDVNRVTLLAYLEGRRLEIGAGNLLVLDNQGYCIIRTNLPDVYGDNMAIGSANVRAAIQGNTVTAFGVGALVIRMSLSTYTPIISGGEQIGVFIARIIMNEDAFVDMFADVFDSHVAIYTGTEVVATTLRNAAGNRALGEEADPRIAQTVLTENNIFRDLMRIDGEPHHVYVFPVHNVAGTPIGMFYMAFSHQRTLRATGVQQRNMILIGIVGLALAAFVMFMYSKKLLAPLNLLTRNLYDIANGDADFNKRLPVISDDEIAEASTYFNQTMDEFKKLVVSIEGHADVLQKKEEVVRERMQAILDSSPLVCAHYDETGKILEVNKEAENMFGIPNKQMFVDNIQKYTPRTQPDGSDSASKNAEWARKAMREGSARFEWTYLHNDGSPIPVEEIVHRINVDGKDHLFVYSRDLREYYREREKERVVQAKIQTMMEQLNEHVEEQTSSVTASSSATEEMIANIRSVTDTLSNNNKNVKELQEASTAGHNSLSEVISDIQGIARESESLLEINAVMENIAGQTNLLSMNAAIEAARAGESGKGFAVVAGEIRKLAESSSQQSNTISGVLKSIKDSIDKITRSTDTVLGKFSAIENGVKTVARQEGLIVSAMEEQGQGSKQILQAISRVNEVTHQVREAARRMVETSKEAMHKTDNTETKAFTDNLTGVRNKKYFLDSAEQELRYCIGEDRDFNIVLFSIDNLQQITDTHGYKIKDEVLKILTMRARNSIKQGTLLARYSDDEFVITLPNVRHGTAVKLAEQIQKKVHDAPFATRGHKLDVTISIGVATKTSASKTLGDITDDAIKALASAKSTGRNKLVSVG